ncbi:MAG: FAD-binding oxidoreductase [Terriglobia bacterium]
MRTDATACKSFGVDGVTPAAVVEPADAKELLAVVHWARSHRAALVPATSGAYLPLGNPPPAFDVAVSLARLNRVLHYDPGDLTLSVEAGIPLAAVQELLGPHRQFLPADPPYADRAAVGGLLAANASGPLRYAYGSWRDFVVGMKFVTGEGKQVKAGGRVVKNVAGYDLSKLMIGALGTLAILTEVNFKLFPLPPRTATAVAAFKEPAAALKMSDRIVHSIWQPTAIELLDPEAARLLASAKSSPVASATGRFLSPDHWSLAVSVGGVEKVIQRYEADLGGLARELKAGHFAFLRNEGERALWAAGRNLLARVREANPAATVVKCALPLTQVGPFLAKARQVAARYELPAVCGAHAGSGIAYIHLLPPAAMADAPRRMAQTATEMIHAGKNLGGRVTIPWCPTEVKRDVNVWGPLGDDFSLMQKLKAQFDPDRILNPGRFLGGL